MRTVNVLLTVLSWLPLPLVHRLGGLLGRCLMLFKNDLRDSARVNIQHCLPDWSEAKRQQLVKQCLGETAKATLELGALWKWPVTRVIENVRDVSGKDLLDHAMAKGKGVILAAPHLGAWEMTGLYVSQYWPLTNLYRPPRQSALNGIMRKGRMRSGANLAATDTSGVRSLFKALGRGEMVGILPDQDPGRGAGVFALFFGVQANTMTLLSRLASKTGAAVFTAYAERLPNGRGYHIHFQSVDVALTNADEVEKATQLNQAVERCVRQQPAQYQWGYKRFKTRPEGEGKFY